MKKINIKALALNRGSSAWLKRIHLGVFPGVSLSTFPLISLRTFRHVFPGLLGLSLISNLTTALAMAGWGDARPRGAAAASARMSLDLFHKPSETTKAMLVRRAPFEAFKAPVEWLEEPKVAKALKAANSLKSLGIVKKKVDADGKDQRVAFTQKEVEMALKVLPASLERLTFQGGLQEGDYDFSRVPQVNIIGVSGPLTVQGRDVGFENLKKDQHIRATLLAELTYVRSLEEVFCHAPAVKLDFSPWFQGSLSNLAQVFPDTHLLYVTVTAGGQPFSTTGAALFRNREAVEAFFANPKKVWEKEAVLNPMGPDTSYWLEGSKEFDRLVKALSPASGSA